MISSAMQFFLLLDVTKNHEGDIMCKDWVVVFQNLETGKVRLDTFTERNETEACKCFWACYRHGNYKILTVVEKPKVENA